MCLTKCIAEQQVICSICGRAVPTLHELILVYKFMYTHVHGRKSTAEFRNMYTCMCYMHCNANDHDHTS